MNDETPDLDPRIIAALRAVAPANDATRERHLAFALAEGRESRTGRRVSGVRRVISFAAASIVMVGIGFGLGLSTGGNNNAGLADAGAIPSTTDNTPNAVKGAAGGATNSAGAVATATESRCSVISTWTMLTTYESGGATRIVYVRSMPSPAIIVMDESNCSVLQMIDLP